ncbi:MAG: sugar ABC transporter ATP-binding protein [Termitinemataceae bacterium]|nr:MAG: sugar ABC transporter ATP-binding protein [Termitinemataceae bacterium]
MQVDSPILELRSVTKTYPGVRALNNISISFKQGEVHALCGENGAGKSTLIKTCSGAIKPDSGKIIISGKEFSSLTPKLSEDNGIAVVYQEFNLVNQLSVAENVFLGRALRKGKFPASIAVDQKAMAEQAAEIFKQFDLAIDPNELICNLTVGYQQIVEIVKALSTDAKLIVMDEPSAPLTNAEVGHLYNIVKKLKEKGVTVIYISHRLDEVFELSDRITVLRDGEMIETVNTKDIDTKKLIALMVGRELTETFPPRQPCIKDQVVLEVDGLCGNGVQNISFAIKRGEILGIGGLVGAGRTETAQLIFGVRPKTTGVIRLLGKSVNYKTPEDAIKMGIALVPEDRKRQGVLLSTTIRENITMAILKRISEFFVVQRKREAEIVEKFHTDLKIKTPTIEQLAKNLSGGNQQKVVIAKWLSSEPEIIILDEPTRGIDVGAKYEIYKLINELVESGKAVIMISSEMEELMGMSDRIIVLAEGCMAGELQKSEFTQEKIMEYASKTKESAA